VGEGVSPQLGLMEMKATVLSGDSQGSICNTKCIPAIEPVSLYALTTLDRFLSFGEVFNGEQQ
jgi:hypothetical protein